MTETELKAAAWDRMYAAAKKKDIELGRPVKIETGIRVCTAMDKIMRAVRQGDQ